jgi:undecaprenyl diphosphate synthase
VDATRAIAAKARAGSLAPEDVDEDLFREHLYDPATPDPDLMIRTAGEMRISNFLLWQISYTELVVTSVCWPEFRAPQLREAIAKYGGRIRKFGGLGQEQTPRAGAGHGADA